MQNLFYFLYRYRTFGLFLLLEVICAWLIVSYNNRQNASFLNSSNLIASTVNMASNNTTDYFQLGKINVLLAEENRILRTQLANQNLTRVVKDTIAEQYSFFKAKVLSNSFRRSQNFLTLNAGSKDGIQPGMGVVSGKGVIGQVKSVSNHFSTVTSLLHRNLLISSSLQRTSTLCTVQWDGQSPFEAALKFVPRHINLAIGDTVVTSGYNAIFPQGIPIGKISAIELQANDVFYDAKVKLEVDFSSLDHVLVIESKMRSVQDSLKFETEKR